MKKKIKVAIIGLGFGKEFIPIYQKYADCGSVAICTRNRQTLDEVGDAFQIPMEDRYTSYDDILKSSDIDAVHINTPIPLHAEQTIAALKAGKHTACTVPAATNIEDLKRIIKAQQQSGKNYMMMETAVYTREFLFARSLLEEGDLGSISFLRGAHYQNMNNWPGYWYGLPPMHYATHAVAPLFALADAFPVKVHCLGSGRVHEDLVKPYGNPYRFETAIFQLSKDDLAAEVSRFLFQTTRQYTESFSIYGEKMSFEWQQIEEEKPILFRGEEAIRVKEVPDRQDLLPREIASFTKHGVYDEENAHLSFIQGAGHGGSHPHLVHEFVSSIVEGRSPYIDAVKSAYWTAAGICAHESAMNKGQEIVIPKFEEV